jgi:hypothetical protein
LGVEEPRFVLCVKVYGKDHLQLLSFPKILSHIIQWCIANH